MSTLFNLMIEDIIISEADFSNDALSQYECPPTEPVSALVYCKKSKLAPWKNHSAEELCIQLSKSVLSPTKKSLSQNQLPKKKFKGRLAMALFDEDFVSEFEMFDEELLDGKKEVELERNAICTSEFFVGDDLNKNIHPSLCDLRYFFN